MKFGEKGGGFFFPISPISCLICPPITPIFELENLYSYKKFTKQGGIPDGWKSK